METNKLKKNSGQYYLKDLIDLNFLYKNSDPFSSLFFFIFYLNFIIIIII